MRPALTLAIVVVVVILVVAIWWPTRVMRRHRMKSPGTSDVIARCAAGHLFTTMWIPNVSFKAVRLGTKRYQHCPVGHHWSMVVPVSVDDLSDAERIEAARVHDIRIP
jgi:hypothetical protein